MKQIIVSSDLIYHKIIDIKFQKKDCVSKIIEKSAIDDITNVTNHSDRIGTHNHLAENQSMNPLRCSFHFLTDSLKQKHFPSIQ